MKEGKVFLTGGDAEGIKLLEPEPVRGFFREFMDQIRGKGACLVSASDSFVVTEACIRARISADVNRLVMF